MSRADRDVGRGVGRAKVVDVVVVGGGHNGLTCAAHLARAGRKVVVLEAREVLGGMAARETFAEGFASPGLLHDTAGVKPSAIAGLELSRHGLGFRDKPPRIWAPSGEGGALWIEPDGVTGDVDDDEAARYAALTGFVGRIGRLLGPMLEAPAPDPHGRLWPLVKTAIGARRLGKRDMTELLRIAPMSVADWMSDALGDERLRAAVAAPALEGAFAGPRSAHTAASLLLRWCGAGAEVIGGPAAVTAALEKAARAAGVELRTGARVVKIRIDDAGGRPAAVGVELADGEVIEAGAVAASCDPKRALLSLVGAQHLSVRLATDAARIRTRGATAKVHLGVAGALETAGGEPIEAARIGASLDELERAFDAAKYGGFSARPMLDVRVPSIGDPSLCPEGHQVVSVLCHFAARDLDGRPDGWTEDRRQELGRVVIDRLAEFVPGLRERIVADEVLTPADIEVRYGTTGGHIYHGEHAPDQLLFLRPTIECSGYATPIPGLFLCGSGCHPGGGITCVPGRLAARAILTG